jgi:hypothetical protein
MIQCFGEFNFLTARSSCSTSGDRVTRAGAGARSSPRPDSRSGARPGPEAGLCLPSHLSSTHSTTPQERLRKVWAVSLLPQYSLWSHWTYPWIVYSEEEVVARGVRRGGFYGVPRRNGFALRRKIVAHVGPR